MLHIINLLCGTGIFLLGITVMSESVEDAFGQRLEGILSRLTKNKLSGVITGFAVTGAIQSSAATTVMTVSFVNSGIMTLESAAGIVMGANIGTTVTSLLIAFNFSSVAPIFIFLGAMIKLFSRNKTRQNIGMLLAGFGMLFLGMNTMSDSFAHLKENPAFLSFVAATKGKAASVLTGFVMTAIMQSSSATVGILQALARQGIIPIDSAIYIIFGQNIGAVIPTLISIIGKNRASKSVGVLHLLFNILGTIIFSAAAVFIPFADILKIIPSPDMQVSVMHMGFNVVSTILLLPFTNGMINICTAVTGFPFKRRKQLSPYACGDRFRFIRHRTHKADQQDI